MDLSSISLQEAKKFVEDFFWFDQEQFAEWTSTYEQIMNSFFIRNSLEEMLNSSDKNEFLKMYQMFLDDYTRQLRNHATEFLFKIHSFSYFSLLESKINSIITFNQFFQELTFLKEKIYQENLTKIQICVFSYNDQPYFKDVFFLIQEEQEKAIQNIFSKDLSLILFDLDFHIDKILKDYQEFMKMYDDVLSSYNELYGAPISQLLTDSQFTVEEKNKFQLLLELPSKYFSNSCEALSELYSFRIGIFAEQRKIFKRRRQQLDKTHLKIHSIEDALNFFKLPYGFVTPEIIIEKKQLLEESYKRKSYDVFSSEYYENQLFLKDLSDSYELLYKPYLQYFLEKQQKENYTREQLTYDLAKSIYDMRKKCSPYIPIFIAQTTEKIIAQRHLQKDTSKIVFEPYSYKYETVAQYSTFTLALTFYKNSWEGFSPDYLHIWLVYLIAHELEHANQHHLDSFSNDSLYSSILHSCNLPHKKICGLISNIDFFILPRSLYSIYLNHRYQSIYDKFYDFSPKERIAKFVGQSLALDVLEILKERNQSFFDEMLDTLFLPYNSTSNPTKYYLQQFKISLPDEIENHASLEERLFYGLSLSSNDLNSFKKDPQATVDMIRKLTRNL